MYSCKEYVLMFIIFGIYKKIISNAHITSVKKYIHINVKPPLHIVGIPIKNMLAEQARAIMDDIIDKPL
jgi:hypothetical protein